MTTPHAKLAELGLALPEVAAPVAAYVPAVQTGNHVYVSGQLPIADGKLLATGKVGADISAEQAKDLARVCALNVLAAVDGLVGLENVVKVVKVVGFVASAPGFTDQPVVINGASELLGARCSARPGGTPAARSAWPSCRWTRRSRSRRSSRSVVTTGRTGGATRWPYDRSHDDRTRDDSRPRVARPAPGLGHAGALRQPGADDPGRHQHLGAARGGGVRGGRHRPGPLDEGHLSGSPSRARSGSCSAPTGTTTTSKGCPRFVELTERRGGPVRSPACRSPDPDAGHTADSVCFLVEADGERVIFTGDTILGRGTTVVAPPDGALGPYLDSLELLTAYDRIPALPGHGPALTDCAVAARFYLAHRKARLDQVRDALAAGAKTPRDVVAMVYADVDRSLWPAAEWTVRAQLEYLGAGSGESSSMPSGLDRP